MPRGRAAATDQTTLRMALVGYEIEREKIDQKIREIRSRLGRSAAGDAAQGAKPGKRAGRARRVLSAAARRRISAAQKRRWAEHRKKNAQAGKGQAG